MVLDPDPQVFDVLLRIDAVEPAGGDDALENGEVLRTVDVAGEQEIISAQRKGAESAFGEAVVERKLRVIKESAQRLALFGRIGERLAELAARRKRWVRG